MITDKDITKLKSVFATKKDLEKFATKEDLKKFATKDDLNQLVTKEEHERLEIRTGEGFADVQGQLDYIKSDVAVLKKDVAILKEDVSQLKVSVSDIQVHLFDMENNIMSALKDLKDDNLITQRRLTNLENRAVAN